MTIKRCQTTTQDKETTQLQMSGVERQENAKQLDTNDHEEIQNDEEEAKDAIKHK